MNWPYDSQLSAEAQASGWGSGDSYAFSNLHRSGTRPRVRYARGRHSILSILNRPGTRPNNDYHVIPSRRRRCRPSLHHPLFWVSSSRCLPLTVSNNCDVSRPPRRAAFSGPWNQPLRASRTDARSRESMYFRFSLSMRRDTAILLLVFFLAGGCSLAGPDGGGDSPSPSDGGSKAVVYVSAGTHV